MNRLYLLNIISFFYCHFLFGQTTQDAYLFSSLDYSITARSGAAGNALGALGGDLADLSLNPAGLGMYRHSSLIFAPSLRSTTIQSSFEGNTLSDNRLGLNVNAIGLVFSKGLKEESDWEYFNFGLAYNRLKSFNQDLLFSGKSKGSRIETWVEDAEGLDPAELNPFESQLAYDTYLIDNPLSLTNYIGALSSLDSSRKEEIVRHSGGIHELAIAGAGNYANKLYVGGALGVNFLRFRELKNYREQALEETLDFNSFDFTENRIVRGTGINLKFGLTYRVNHFILFGLSMHSPMFFRLKETYNTELSGDVYYVDTTLQSSFASPTGSYSHGFNSPWNFTFSTALLIGAKGNKKGFLGVDLNYLNYAWSTFYILPGDETATIDDKLFISNMNNNIQNLHQNSFRLRVGAGWKLEQVAFRLGYNLNTSPYKVSVSGINDLEHRISGGVGISGKHIFLDLGYIHYLRQFEYLPYTSFSSPNIQQVIGHSRSGQILLTVGLRW